MRNEAHNEWAFIMWHIMCARLKCKAGYWPHRRRRDDQPLSVSVSVIVLGGGGGNFIRCYSSLFDE